MKYFKLTCYFIIITFVFTSCTNGEPVNIESDTKESASITKSLVALRSKLNQDGSLNSNENPANNILFDFCFDFVYPLELSYNNGVVVIVDGLDELITVIINYTGNLYIDGIRFPFDVEVYNEATGTIEVQTINNEEEFITLVEDCSFDIAPCECTDNYDPACVEIEDVDGTIFVMTYYNACEAKCDGFTESDFVEDCVDPSRCITLNFPLEIITNENETITINSQEELDLALYNIYSYEFVYPISVFYLVAEETMTLNSKEDYKILLIDCAGVLDNI